MAPSAIGMDVMSADSDNRFYRNGYDTRNGHVDGQLDSSLLHTAGDDEVQDLICVGFGPASLAIAVAVHDMLESTQIYSPKVRFLERQTQFGWHAGMLLPGTKMQISFIKDLATLRDPQSKFTFLNYLQEHDRLVQFSNLDTFLPFRVEFEDYLRWVASHFENVVDYGQDVQHVRPLKLHGGDKFDCFEVISRDSRTGKETRLLSRNVVVAVGGRPSKPAIFANNFERVIHSSQYRHHIKHLMPNTEQDYNVAVVGSGQSAAEIFHDLHSRYPNATTQMVVRDTALRPSDDSPFVNEVFDPDAVDEFYRQPPETRAKTLMRNKATNYSVVRLNLLEHIYEDLYHQYLKQPDKDKWQHRILTTREIVRVQETPSKGRIQLELKNTNPTAPQPGDILDLDAVVLATGYVRNVHVDMLHDCQSINGTADGQWVAGRDYQVNINRMLAQDDLGIWLQGCNEQTHGLADTLLSVLATRSGELVEAMFGDHVRINRKASQLL